MMPQIELTLVTGQYAIACHLPEMKKESLTNTVKEWKIHWPAHLALPHPSPRNNIWLKKNVWFEDEIVPVLQKRVKSILS